MLKEVKEKLVNQLRKVGEKELTTAQSYPVIKELRKVLSQMYPQVDFNDLQGKRVEGSIGDKQMTVGGRGESWDNILEYAGIQSIDFPVPNYTFMGRLDTGEIEVNPVWSEGYEHPTTGSIIAKRFNYKETTTYEQMAEILDKHL